MAPKFSNQRLFLSSLRMDLLSLSSSPTPFSLFQLPFLRGGGSKEFRKPEIYTVHEVKKDGRCLFRALVKGILAANTGPLPDLTEREEQKRAE
ncbi:uncharacterized protein LOC112194108 isoform X2 [Rosa chinensis]|uniref:uncharacterized protein LOC112194108 isoform X2 n=1 Tax=Rosa chinensis TaxID=74649 RepID=UPI001AD93DBD|nr:uncharacterized protein LOC112194108 isoform X2 [Rosa chinensis]